MPEVTDMPESAPESAGEDSAVEKSAAWDELTEESAPELPADELALPEDNRQFEPELARHLLSLCSGHTAENERRLLENAGFEVLRGGVYEELEHWVEQAVNRDVIVAAKR